MAGVDGIRGCARGCTSLSRSLTGSVCGWAQILNHGGAAAGVQTLLFSATLPSWVRDITKRFLQPGFKTVDLVGTDKMKARPACASRRP